MADLGIVQLATIPDSCATVHVLARSTPGALVNSMLRRLTELLARGRVFRRKIIVSGYQVELYVSPDAQLKYLKLSNDAFDADLIRIAECFVKPGDCVWDIGANVGVFTFAASNRSGSGTVVAVEADIWLASILRRTCHLQSQVGRDIRIVPAAIADTDTVLKFRIAGRGRAANALSVVSGSSQMGGTREEQYVPAITLDTLLKAMPQPDFVKIDVEGAEHLVLDGAKITISTVRPTFYIEVSTANFPKMKALFDNSDYAIFDASGSVAQTCEASNFFFVPNNSATKLRAVEALRAQTH